MGSRLRFAIAASKSQDILLVDEALATGDAEFRVKSHARIEELRQDAGTVFLVAHNLEEVELTCNRVIWMERGQIVTQGEDVIGIIDRYIEASGGTPVERDPATGPAAPPMAAELPGLPHGGQGLSLPRLHGARRSDPQGRITVPPPSRPSAVTSPSWARASWRTMYSPSPIPPNLRRSPVSPWTNRSKTRSRSAGGMPIPSSSTVTSIWSPDARAPTVTFPPSGEYLKAFSSSWPMMTSVAVGSPKAFGS